MALQVDAPPAFLTMPYIGCKARLGIDETILTPEDMTSYEAYWKLWIQLSTKKEQWLGESDFKTVDLYYKYFFSSTGLLEYPMVMIGGDVGKGKSLIRSILTWWPMKLYGKGACMDAAPPEPEKFEKYGKLHNLYDQDYVNLIVNELKELNIIEGQIARCKDTDERVILREKRKLLLEKMILYNTNGSYDEAHMWADCSRTFNLTVLVQRVAIIRRHLHMGMYFCFVNPRRANKLILPLRTHQIECFKDGFPEMGPGYCNFQITDVRPGGTGVTKWLHARPEQWKGYWDSENIPTIVHDVDIYLGGKKKAKPNNTDWDQISGNLKE